MLTKMSAFAVIVLLSNSYPINTYAQQKEQIYGEWVFEKFELTEAGIQKGERVKGDHGMKGLTMVFLADGKFRSIQKGGSADNNFEAVYRYYPDKKNLIIEKKDEGTNRLKVLLIDKTTLKLMLSDEYAIMILTKAG